MSQGHVLDSVAHRASAAVTDFLERWGNSSGKKNKDRERRKKSALASLTTRGTLASPERRSSLGESGAEMNGVSFDCMWSKGQATKLCVTKRGPNTSSFAPCFFLLRIPGHQVQNWTCI